MKVKNIIEKNGHHCKIKYVNFIFDIDNSNKKICQYRRKHT